MIGRNIVEEPVLRLALFGAVRGWSCTGADIRPAGRKAQAILAYLAVNEHTEVPRRRLTGLLWSDRGEDQARASLRQSLMELRRALGAFESRVLTIGKESVALDRSAVWIDQFSVHPGTAANDSPLAAPEPFLESLFGLDPQFDAWIEAARQQFGQNTRPLQAALPAAASARRLSVAVMPFEAVGALGEDDYLPAAMMQEVLAALARFRWFLVRPGSPNTPQTDDYTVNGSVRRSGTGFRIAVRLSDPAANGAILAAHQVEVSLAELNAAIGGIAERIVGQLDPQILAIETRKATAKPATSLSAYECVLRAIPLLYRFEEGAWRLSVNLLDQAIALDPDYSRAFAFSAMARGTGTGQGWLAATPEAHQTILRHSARAVECDPCDSLGLAIGAHCQVLISHAFPRALAMYDSALRHNPSCGFAWGYSAAAYAYLGRVEEARERLERAREVMLFDPFGSLLDTFEAVITYFEGDWPAAIAFCERQLVARPGFTNIRKLLIAALAQAGRADAAGRQHAALMLAEPNFSWQRHLQIYPFGREADRRALSAALSRCRIPLVLNTPLRPAADVAMFVPLKRKASNDR